MGFSFWLKFQKAIFNTLGEPTYCKLKTKLQCNRLIVNLKQNYYPKEFGG